MIKYYLIERKKKEFQLQVQQNSQKIEIHKKERDRQQVIYSEWCSSNGVHSCFRAHVQIITIIRRRSAGLEGRSFVCYTRTNTNLTISQSAANISWCNSVSVRVYRKYDCEYL